MPITIYRFDEVHTGNFVNTYFMGEYSFDILPPLSKLIFYAFAKFLGYTGSFSFVSIGQSFFAENFPILSLRTLCTLFGTLSIMITFLILRTLGVPSLLSFFSASLLLFGNFRLPSIFLENSFLLLNRFVLADSPYIFFSLASFYFSINFIFNNA